MARGREVQGAEGLFEKIQLGGLFAKQSYQPFTYGNAGRNIREAPSTFKWDMAIHKNFQPTERIRFQFRAESFNSLNHSIFDSPNETVGNRNFGIISNAAPGRVMQMGLKVVF